MLRILQIWRFPLFNISIICDKICSANSTTTWLDAGLLLQIYLRIFSSNSTPWTGTFKGCSHYGSFHIFQHFSRWKSAWHQRRKWAKIIDRSFYSTRFLHGICTDLMHFFFPTENASGFWCGIWLGYHVLKSAIWTGSLLLKVARLVPAFLRFVYKLQIRSCGFRLGSHLRLQDSIMKTQSKSGSVVGCPTSIPATDPLLPLVLTTSVKQILQTWWEPTLSCGFGHRIWENTNLHPIRNYIY